MRITDLLIIVLLLLGAFAFGRCGVPVQEGEIPIADTVYVDREVPKKYT